MEGGNGGGGQRLQSSSEASSSASSYSSSLVAVNQEICTNVHQQLQIPELHGQIRHVPRSLWFENSGNMAGFSPSYPQMPPISPYSQIPSNRSVAEHHTFTDGFSAVPLPPLVPSRYGGFGSSFVPSVLFPMEQRAESLPPNKAHRRSSSDIPLGIFNGILSPPPVQLTREVSSLEKDGDKSAGIIGETKSEGELVDDLFSAYMNLDNIDVLNSSGTYNNLGNDNREDLDSRASGSKTNDIIDNESASSVNESHGGLLHQGLAKMEGVKRNAVGDVALRTRHFRSVSMDSSTGKISYDLESPIGMQPGSLSPAKSLEGNESSFSLEFGNSEFTGAELKKIVANEKLAEIACGDPKRVKRILANRQSAARSKERKLRYMAELEHKVQNLQTEAATLSAKLTFLQQGFIGLTNQNHELKYRLHAMEQQARLRNALNEALRAEVQRLKLATTESNRDTWKHQQQAITPQIHQLLHNQQQPTQLHIHHMQQSQQQPLGNRTSQQQSHATKLSETEPEPR